ncbi:EboA domain-containing protein [Agromyces sp. MMS24-K17]|uniref:EboA domain-containing protein n=1 Tax=Agromyces sp. MMS24-K17 TaxID=3372850 RepID=UPI0037548059
MTNAWTEEAVRLITADPERIAELFPAAGREVGRAPLAPDTDPLGLTAGTADDLAREQLVAALLRALPPADAAAELADLYRYGDDAEQRGVLRGLNAAEAAGAITGGGDAQRRGDDAGEASAPVVDAVPVVATGLRLVAEALRSNDPRLVAAALGAFAAARLDQHAWRHGVLKALFMGIPLAAVAGLHARADDELARMAAGLIAERRAAGRSVTDDMTRLATDPTED